jgi:hypothetical protein
LTVILAATEANGASNYVTSISALQTRINNSSAGDLIVLANGTYSNNTISVSKSGITVRAATPGGVFLNGTDDITISGSRVTFSGFQFTSSGSNTSGIPIDVTGSQNLLTQLNFDGYSVQKYINIQAPSRSNEVAYCNFRNKPPTAQPGNLIHVEADPSVVGYHKIRYCSFHDMPGSGGDFGNECIRLSNGAESNYVSSTVVEYCYFENTGLGDSEAISVKCRGNVLRYNTFTNNQTAMMVFRNGNDNIAYGNFFIKVGGIRVKEANNIYCYNNYFENSGVGGATDAVKLDYQGAVTPENPNPNICSNINFLHNTFVECGDVDLGGTGPVTNTWANNIFKKSSGAIFVNPNLGTTWAGNIRSGTLGITIPSGMTNLDPQLVVNADGYFGLASSSPAIDASSTNHAAILDILNVDDDPSSLLDISRQTRPANRGLKDVGCDEFTTGGTSNRPLSLSDVGPAYLGGPGGATAPSIGTQPQDRTVDVGAPVSFFVVASGTAPLSYQWRKNGTNIIGATAATNSIVSAQTNDAGSYAVVVTNLAGSVTSAVATLTINTLVARANVFLDDRWLDGSRTDTALPTNAAWHANDTASLAAVTNSLLASPDPASTLTWWTYFTANPAAPVALNVSDKLRVTLAFTAAGVNLNNASRGLRLGLYDSSNGTRTVVDGANPDGTDVTGYMLSLNIGQTFGGSPTMQFMERTNLPSSNLIGTVNDYAALSSGGPAAGSPGFRNGVPYLLELRVGRTANSVDITATVSNTNGWSISHTMTDTNNVTFAFDTFVFRPAVQPQTMTNFTFTQFKVELITTNVSAPVAPAITNQPASLIVNAGSSAAFTAGATGDGPLAYQWRFYGSNIDNAIGTSYSLASAQATNAGSYTVVVTNAAGSVTSILATLTVNLPPAIGADPQSQTVNEGAPVSFFVVATGTAPLGYQWQKSGTNIIGATTATNSILAAQTTDAGGYTVVVTNVAGSFTSAVATLTVNVPPLVTTQPLSQTVNAGAPVSFSVVATNTPRLSYQWRRNGTIIAGATGATNSITSAQSTNAGSYTVVVTNVAGSITSAVATLAVIIVPPQITGIISAGSGTVTLSGTGSVGELYRILATTNIVLPVAAWPVVDTGAFTGGVFSFTDNETTNHAQRFYRVASP